MGSTRTAPRQQRDALGLKLCRMPECGKPIPKGRKSYCSSACADAFGIAYFPSFARRAVFERDQGVCALCGCDTEKVRRILTAIRYAVGRTCYGRGDWKSAQGIARELGFEGFTHRGELWQADHITECARGGWGLGLDNFRTLCTPCHKSESARLARELAEDRKRQRAGNGLFSPSQPAPGSAPSQTGGAR